MKFERIENESSRFLKVDRQRIKINNVNNVNNARIYKTLTFSCRPSGSPPA